MMPVDVESRLAGLGEVWSETRHVSADEVRERLDWTAQQRVAGRVSQSASSRSAWLPGAAAALVLALVGSLVWLGRGAEPGPGAPAAEPVSTPDPAVEVDNALDEVPGEVIGREPANGGRVDIDVGALDGIRVGMPVISSEGLVGKVVAVFETSSIVLLVTEPGFALAASVDGFDDRRAYMVEGRGSGERLGLVSPDGPPEPSELANGDVVVTAGGVQSLAPAAIPIGQVATNDGGDVMVEPFVDLSAVSSVSVLLHIPPVDR